MIGEFRLTKCQKDFNMHQEIFTEIYDHNIWGNTDGSVFFSGGGSRGESADFYVEIISQFIENNSIKKIVDLGCGDFYIGNRIVERTKVEYIGVDCVEKLVKYNSEKFPNSKFYHQNITVGVPFTGDLCLIRQVLQHLSNQDIINILNNCHHFPCVIITDAVNGPVINEDIVTSRYTRIYGQIDLTKPPFNLYSEILFEHNQLRAFKWRPNEKFSIGQ